MRAIYAERKGCDDRPETEGNLMCMSPKDSENNISNGKRGDAPGKKILIVDDEIEVIDFAWTVLKEGGYTPISAMNGEEGMKKVRDEKPDLVLLDILMPKRGGIAMYHDLKHNEETRNIPVIIITAIAEQDSGPLGAHFKEIMMRESQDAPAPDGYIEKPVNGDRMLRLVRALLS
jgi:CheY-like chemotaxis protein